MTAAPRPWVFLGHTFARVGPPVCLLHHLRWLAEHDPRPVEVVALADGDLRPAFAEVATTHVLPGADLSHLAGAELVVVNTVASAAALAALPPSGAAVVVMVHELETGLTVHVPEAVRAAALRPGHRFVAASRAVAENLVRNHGIDPAAVVVHHEVIDTAAPSSGATGDVRAAAGIPAGAPLVGTAAVTEWRKGPDLFVRLLRSLGDDVHGVWLSADPPGADAARFRDDARAAGLAARVHHLPPVADPRDWMRAFDVFALTAREDAFPLAALEAASVATPLVCFDTGGLPELVADGAGTVVPYPDVAAFAGAVGDLLDDPAGRRATGDRARELVRTRHDVRVGAPRLHEDLLRWSAA